MNKTLEELIEESGDRFGFLSKEIGGNHWHCQDNHFHIYPQAETPREAVMNLLEGLTSKE